MRENPIQFAVVREDPRVERAVLARHPASRALLVASGGCTALALQGWQPDLDLTLLDPNPAQLDLVRAKIDALGGPLHRFNVEDDAPDGLSQRGNFESLFRGLRGFVHEMIVPEDTLRRRFDAGGGFEDLIASRWWPVAFEMFFCDPLLVTMFGPAAVQHAPPGSYPAYFRQAFETGLRRADARDNPFLHHVLLGRYLARSLPDFLTIPLKPRFSWLQRFVHEVDDFGAWGLLGLSNLFDWMAPTEVEALMARLVAETRPGAVVVWRQLNNNRDLEALLAGAFDFDPAWQRALHAADRSLFYRSVHVGVRR